MRPGTHAGRGGRVPRVETLRFGGPLHLQAVLVGAGEEEDLVTEQAMPAGEHVGRDGRCTRARYGATSLT